LKNKIINHSKKSIFSYYIIKMLPDERVPIQKPEKMDRTVRHKFMLEKFVLIIEFMIYRLHCVVSGYFFRMK